jgi:hypothetical protein
MHRSAENHHRLRENHQQYRIPDNGHVAVASRILLIKSDLFQSATVGVNLATAMHYP